MWKFTATALNTTLSSCGEQPSSTSSVGKQIWMSTYGAEAFACLNHVGMSEAAEAWLTKVIHSCRGRILWLREEYE